MTFINKQYCIIWKIFKNIHHDKIKNVLSYEEIIVIINKISKKNHKFLAETVAEDIAQECLKLDTAISVRVSLKKPDIALAIFKRHKVNINPDQVVVVPGGKVTMWHCILMFGGNGKEILYPNPGFPIYESAIKFSGAKAVPIPLLEKTNFSFDPLSF